MRDAVEQRLRDPLPVGVRLEQPAFLRVGDERDLREHAGHAGADEHDEGRLLHAEVAHVVLLRSRSTIARCTIVAKSRDSSSLLLSVMAFTMSGRLCIVRPEAEFSRAATASRLGVRREVQEVGLDAARLGVSAGVRVNREEQVRLLAVGDRRPLLERHEHVGAAREHHLDARLLQQQLLEPQRHVEHEVGFLQVLALRAGVVAAVARDR